MKLTALLLLFILTPLWCYTQYQDCLFPFSSDADSALVKVWLDKNENLNEAQKERIRKKKVNSRFGKAVVDSLWRETVSWLKARLGREVLCEQVSGNFPHFVVEEKNRLFFQFFFYEMPAAPNRNAFFSFQIYYEKTSQGWKLIAPDYLPDCKNKPEQCQKTIDRNKTKRIAAQHGIKGSFEYDLQIHRLSHNAPFQFRIVKPKAAGECTDSVWTIDRRTGIITDPRTEWTPHCVTYQQLVTAAPVVVEAQEIAEQPLMLENGSIATKHSYRVLQVFKGDNIPDFIEVVQPGGSTDKLSTHLSHGTVLLLKDKKSGLLFLSEFTGQLFGDTIGEQYFRYKTYHPYSHQLTYGEANRVFSKKRIQSPEHLLLRPIEEYTGQKREWRQWGHIRDESIVHKMQRKGYGYKNGQPGILVSLYAYDESSNFSISLEASPTPLYIDSIDIHIRYDTSLLGKNVVKRKILALEENTSSMYGRFDPKFFTCKLKDYSDGIVSLSIRTNSDEPPIPIHAIQPNGHKEFLLPIRVKLPKAYAKTIRFALVDFDQQPGGQHFDFNNSSLQPLSFVLGTSTADFPAPLNLSVAQPSIDTFTFQLAERNKHISINSLALNDPTIEAWVPIKVLANAGGPSILTYERLTPSALSYLPDGKLKLSFGFGYWKAENTELPTVLRSGPIYLSRPRGYDKGETLEVAYLKITEK